MNKRQRKNRIAGYAERYANLWEMGYRATGYVARYKEYRESPLWKKIRRRQLKAFPTCYGCGGKANQVHHRSYDLATLRGKSQKHLASVCRECHERISLGEPSPDNPEKRRVVSVTESNRRLDELHAMLPVPHVVKKPPLSQSRPANTISKSKSRKKKKRLREKARRTNTRPETPQGLQDRLTFERIKRKCLNYGVSLSKSAKYSWVFKKSRNRVFVWQPNANGVWHYRGNKGNATVPDEVMAIALRFVA